MRKGATTVKTVFLEGRVGFSVGEDCREKVEAGELLKGFDFLFKKER